jgi:hypothetical protein
MCLIALVFVVDTGWLPAVSLWIHEVPMLDKVIHFSLYGTLALVVNLALASRDRRSLVRAVVLVGQRHFAAGFRCKSGGGMVMHHGPALS